MLLCVCSVIGLEGARKYTHRIWPQLGRTEVSLHVQHMTSKVIGLLEGVKCMTVYATIRCYCPDGKCS